MWRFCASRNTAEKSRRSNGCLARGLRHSLASFKRVNVALTSTDESEHTVAFDLLTRLGGDEPMAAVFSQERAVTDWLLVEAELGRALAAAGVVDHATGERIAQA